MVYPGMSRNHRKIWLRGCWPFHLTGSWHCPPLRGLEELTAFTAGFSKGATVAWLSHSCPDGRDLRRNLHYGKLRLLHFNHFHFVSQGQCDLIAKAFALALAAGVLPACPICWLWLGTSLSRSFEPGDAHGIFGEALRSITGWHPPKWADCWLIADWSGFCVGFVSCVHIVGLRVNRVNCVNRLNSSFRLSSMDSGCRPQVCSEKLTSVVGILHLWRHLCLASLDFLASWCWGRCLGQLSRRL